MVEKRGGGGWSPSNVGVVLSLLISMGHEVRREKCYEQLQCEELLVLFKSSKEGS